MARRRTIATCLCLTTSSPRLHTLPSSFVSPAPTRDGLFVAGVNPSHARRILFEKGSWTTQRIEGKGAGKESSRALERGWSQSTRSRHDEGTPRSAARLVKGRKQEDEVNAIRECVASVDGGPQRNVGGHHPCPASEVRSVRTMCGACVKMSDDDDDERDCGEMCVPQCVRRGARECSVFRAGRRRAPQQARPRRW